METPKGPLQLDVYPGPDCRGQLYFDDGVSTKGASLRQTVECIATSAGTALHFGARRGSWRPWWTQIAVIVHGPHEARMTISDQPHDAVVTIH